MRIRSSGRICLLDSRTFSDDAENSANPVPRGPFGDFEAGLVSSFNLVWLNRALSDMTVVIEKRKPFDLLAKRLAFEQSRGNKTPIELFRPPICEIKGDVAGLIRDATPDFKSGSAPLSTG